MLNKLDIAKQYESILNGERKRSLVNNETDIRKVQCASTDAKETFCGSISYIVDNNIKAAKNFSVCSAHTNDVNLAADVMRAIDDIFSKDQLNKIEWECIDYQNCDSEIDHWRSFIKKYGGREAGYREDNVLLRNGSYTNTYYFEITKKQYEDHHSDDSTYHETENKSTIEYLNARIEELSAKNAVLEEKMKEMDETDSQRDIGFN